ncbi:MAG: hypothetical protein U9P44_03350 [archaeon]|nr:hypothetical protein [archaeon]
MIFDLNIYILCIIIAILLGIVWGMRRIFDLERKMTELLSIIKAEEEQIDRKLPASRKFKSARDKQAIKRKLLSKIKKKKV